MMSFAKGVAFGAAAVVAAFAVVAEGGAETAELERLVREDVARPVRPIGVNGQEPWNVQSTWFMYPPSFAFPAVKGARGYRVRVVDASGGVRRFTQDGPLVSLEKCWSDLPTGRTEVWCDAFCGGGPWTAHWTCGRSFRVFWKAAPYRPGAYPRAPRSYADAARRCCAYLMASPWLRTFAATGRPDPAYRLNSYPAKMDTAVIRLALLCGDVSLAKTAADYLISVSQAPDAPLGGFPPTYAGKEYTAGKYAGMNMLIYPAGAASAYLELHAATGEAKYRDAARRIAETYLRLQGADGTWPLKAWEKDGAPVGANRLLPATVIALFESMEKLTGDARYRAAADRAFGYYERGPLRDWNWEGQFEDVEPTGKYVNLTKHPACELAIRLASRVPRDEKRIAQARELLRFAEDQFVVWERPARAEDGDLMALLGDGWDVAPAVVEQYFYREAVDASAAKLIQTYLALYDATGNPLDLAKARTLGDSIVRTQKADGRIPTIWTTSVGADLQSDWINCTAASIAALQRLSKY